MQAQLEVDAPSDSGVYQKNARGYQSIQIRVEVQACTLSSLHALYSARYT